jgi:2-polyprenyl-3-methyl-5-hydroxy-6-metoxy-1,4-benzoquinol methylase
MQPKRSTTLSEAVASFRSVLGSIRAAKPEIDWYRYDSLQNVEHIGKVLKGTGLSLDELIAAGDILDIGCADGDFAFFLESLGASVTAIDHPRSNHNRMEAVYALKDALNSSIEIRQVDLEHPFDPGPARYGLVCLLGVLYHLRNPFTVLEVLSRHTRFCLLSTRITEYLPDRKTHIGDAPVAYLVDEYELNRDYTNFWIFTETGLRRLLSRTSWRVLSLVRLGHTRVSDPVSDNDERAFCLLESRSGAFESVDIGAGWHHIEKDGWRWTARQFSARLYREKPGRATLRLDAFVPEALLARTGTITLSATCNGVDLPSRCFASPGPAVYEAAVDLAHLPATLHFTLDRALPPEATDPRERGIIVTAIGLSE